jgi:hypothetical protein
MHFGALGEALEWGLNFFFFKVRFFFFFFFLSQICSCIMSQIMQSFQLDLKNFHYSLCEIQSVFLFFSFFFFFFFFFFLSISSYYFVYC